MKYHTKKIIAAIFLTLLLVPAGALAQREINDIGGPLITPQQQAIDKSLALPNNKNNNQKSYSDYLSSDEKKTITNNLLEKGCNSKTLNAIFKEGGLCLSREQMEKNIYTVLETPLDTPENTSQNQDGTFVKSCARFTQILNCGKAGEDKVTDQHLIKECPPENQIPGGSYGAARDSSGRYTGEYFDCQPVTVILSPLEQGAVGFLNAYVGLIYRWVAGIIGIICVLIIIVSGLQITTAQGEPSAVEEGKKRIYQAIGGIALLFLASAILYVINPTFFNIPKY